MKETLATDRLIKELKLFAPLYRLVFERLEAVKLLEPFRSHARSLLVALDGTEYFSSQKIRCPNCSHRELTNGKTNYYHSVITPVIVQADNEHMISLEPEFIVPQDGHEKQDCEIEAGKRWLRTHSEYYARLETSVEAIARDGRARWKIENDTARQGSAREIITF